MAWGDVTYFFRLVVEPPPEDWPVKGVRGYDVSEQRRDYVRNYPNGAQAVARKLAAIRARNSKKAAVLEEVE